MAALVALSPVEGPGEVGFRRDECRRYLFGGRRHHPRSLVRDSSGRQMAALVALSPVERTWARWGCRVEYGRYLFWGRGPRPRSLVRGLLGTTDGRSCRPEPRRTAWGGGVVATNAGAICFGRADPAPGPSSGASSGRQTAALVALSPVEGPGEVGFRRDEYGRYLFWGCRPRHRSLVRGLLGTTEGRSCRPEPRRRAWGGGVVATNAGVICFGAQTPPQVPRPGPPRDDRRPSPARPLARASGRSWSQGPGSRPALCPRARCGRRRSL